LLFGGKKAHILITIRSLSDVTRILESIQPGDPKAADELLPLVYAELRKLAAYKMAKCAAGHTLQPTALVHEVWMRLVGTENPTFENRCYELFCYRTFA